MADLHVVFGATGGAGQAIVRALADRGERVRAVSRGTANLPAGVEHIRADASNSAAARDAAKGAAVVYHAVNAPYPQWKAVLANLMMNILAAAAGARVVYIDNLYMYGKVDGPLRDGLPEAATGPKGRLRAELGQRVLAAHQSGAVNATIARGSDFFGPGIVSSTLPLEAFENIRDGKSATWYGRADQPHALTYIDDYAHAVITLVSHDAAFGRSWIIPTAEPLTGRQYADLIGDVVGRPARLKTMNSLMVRLASPFNAMAREFVEEIYQVESPWIVDGSDYTRTFGDLGVTPHRQAIELTLASIAKRETTAA